jgi:hypothetical protein
MITRHLQSGRFIAIASIAVASALAGCSSSSNAPTAADYDDVAQSTAALMAPQGGGGEIGSISASASLAAGITPSNLTLGASGSFDGQSAGVSYSFTLACTDAHSAALPHCGPTTNDAHATVDWSGTLSLTGLTATVQRHGAWDLTGVSTGTATFDGSGSFSFDAQFMSVFRNEQATASLSYDATYASITYDEAAHAITGGKVHYTVSASAMSSSTHGSSSGSFAMDAVLTFGPNGTATLVLDGSHTYLIAASGLVTKV